jgi:hypothetical protein
MHLRILSFLILTVFISISAFSQNNSPDSDTLEASFPGGTQAWRRFLERNLRAEIPMENGAPCGLYTVRVKFIVAKDGSTADVIPLTNMGFGMEQEVIRIIKLSGNWLPGSINTEPVHSYHEQPVTFVISVEGFNVKTKVPNKLFTGIDNEIVVTVDNEKTKNLTATISNGKMVSFADGIAVVKVIDTTKRAVLTIYNEKKNNKEIAAYSFSVRPQREAPDAKKD